MARRSHLGNQTSPSGSIWRAQRFQAAQEQFDAPAAVIKAPEIDEHVPCQDGRYQNLHAANSTNRARSDASRAVATAQQNHVRILPRRLRAEIG